MGDDDEWDVDEGALEKQLAEKQKEIERQKRREAGEESEDEDEPTPAVQSASPTNTGDKPKPKPKAKKKKGKEEEKPQEEEGPKLTAQEEKLRRRQLELEADDRLADDLFSGCKKADAELEKEEEDKRKKKEAEEEAERKRKEAANKPKVVIEDQFEKVTLDVQKDVENLARGCMGKINKAKAKEAGGRFLTEVLKGLEPLLSFQELGEVEKLLAEAVKQGKAAKSATNNATGDKEKKAATKINKNTKFDAGGEWEEVYGGGEGDEDWTAEEWAEWEKKEAAEWTKWEASQKK